MNKELSLKIKELEDYIGFEIKRDNVILDSNELEADTFIYPVFLRFYEEKEELKKAIEMLSKIILDLTNQNENQTTIYIKPRII